MGATDIRPVTGTGGYQILTNCRLDSVIGAGSNAYGVSSRGSAYIECNQCVISGTTFDAYQTDRGNTVCRNCTLSNDTFTGNVTFSEDGLDWSQIRKPTSTVGLTDTTVLANVALSDQNIDDIAAGIGAAIAVSAFNVDKDHTWSFAKNQTTASNIITEPIGFNALLAMDFSDQIPARDSILSITSATFANIAGTEPTVSSSAASADRKAAHIMVDATSATAGTYTLSVKVLTADGQTFVRQGRLAVT